LQKKLVHIVSALSVIVLASAAFPQGSAPTSEGTTLDDDSRTEAEQRRRKRAFVCF
jgi:hypothetical protein